MLGTVSNHSIRGLFILSLIFMLTGCGGGGGNSGGNKSSSSSAPGFVANAGSDKTVNAGDRVELKSSVTVAGEPGLTLSGSSLELKGDSTNPKDLLSLSWTQVDGPSISLMSNFVNKADPYFIAPSTGTAQSIKITYKLTLVRVDGTKAEDLVIISVNRVNAPPTANAGQDITAETDTTVELPGVGIDSDGTVVSYSWRQILGEAAELSNSTSATLSFVPPSVIVATDLEFEFTATDNDGSKSTDNVIVHLIPGNLPRLAMLFPPVAGIYNNSSISAFGTVSAKSGDITNLKLSIGSNVVDATIDSEGNWRASDLTIPSGTSEIVIHATATDSNGYSRTVTSTLTTGGSFTDSLESGPFIGLAVDDSKKVAYILTHGNLNQIRLLPIDLVTGKRGAAISTFSDTSQGINTAALGAMAYSPEKHLIFVSFAPAGENAVSGIISIDTVTGMRNVVSNNVKGSGPAFNLPYGIAVGSNNTLYVADNLNHEIVKVDTETGNRTVIQSVNSAGNAIRYPLLVASDNTQNSERLFVLPNADINYILGMIPTLPFYSTLISDSLDSSQGPTIVAGAKGFVVDPTLNLLFTLDESNTVMKVDIATGTRTKLLEPMFAFGMTYSQKNHLLYSLEGIPTNLYVADPITGQQVLINRGN